MNNCLFCEIVAGNTQADVVLEDEQILAFNDINAQAPTHILIIPKLHISTLNELEDNDLAGKLLITTTKIANQQGFSEQGYRSVINCNAQGGQEVYHLHLHLLGGRMMNWPPG